VEVHGATASQLFEKARNFAITGIKNEGDGELKGGGHVTGSFSHFALF